MRLREFTVIQGPASREPHALSETFEPLGKALVAHHQRLYWQAFRILGNREDAEDALQDGLLNAVRHFDQFEGRSKLSTWLTRVMINAALMARRGKHGFRETSLNNLLSREDESPIGIPDRRQPGPEQLYASSEIRVLISEQFDLLSPTLRSAFQLCHIDGLSCQETGRSLGVTLSAMKSRVARAKRQMAWRLNRSRREPDQSEFNKRRET